MALFVDGDGKLAGLKKQTKTNLQILWRIQKWFSRFCLDEVRSVASHGAIARSDLELIANVGFQTVDGAFGVARFDFLLEFRSFSSVKDFVVEGGVDGVPFQDDGTFRGRDHADVERWRQATWR